MNTYLVTGAAGFIGSKVAEMLLQRGDKVIGIDNLNDYYDIRIKKHRLSALESNAHFHFLQLDTNDSIGLKVLFEKYPFKAVYHLAACAGVRYSVENPRLYFQSNAMGTLNVLEQMRFAKTPKLILASTSSLYADNEIPFSEIATTDSPRSPYAASKKAAETLAYTYHHVHGLDVSILRYFTVYGPLGRPDMSPLRFINQVDKGHPITLYGDGSQGRDFTYIDDIVEGTLLAEKSLGYEILNLGYGNEPTRIDTFISTVEELLGKPAVINRKPFIRADMQDTMADVSKAKELLGWVPKTPLLAGLGSTVDWWRENRQGVQDYYSTD